MVLLFSRKLFKILISNVTILEFNQGWLMFSFVNELHFRENIDFIWKCLHTASISPRSIFKFTAKKLKDTKPKAHHSK